MRAIWRFALASLMLFAAHPTNAEGLAQPKLRTEPLTIETETGEYQFNVEIAMSSEERERGLMYRTELGANEGMLFISDREEIVSMWMKDTPLSLDIIFIDGGGKVINFVQHTTPYSLQPISSAGPARAALELPAGTAKHMRLRFGDRVWHKFLQ